MRDDRGEDATPSAPQSRHRQARQETGQAPTAHPRARPRSSRRRRGWPRGEPNRRLTAPWTAPQKKRLSTTGASTTPWTTESHPPSDPASIGHQGANAWMESSATFTLVATRTNASIERPLIRRSRSEDVSPSPHAAPISKATGSRTRVCKNAPRSHARLGGQGAPGRCAHGAKRRLTNQSRTAPAPLEGRGTCRHPRQVRAAPRTWAWPRASCEFWTWRTRLSVYVDGQAEQRALCPSLDAGEDQAHPGDRTACVATGMNDGILRSDRRTTGPRAIPRFRGCLRGMPGPRAGGGGARPHQEGVRGLRSPARGQPAWYWIPAFLSSPLSV